MERLFVGPELEWSFQPACHGDLVMIDLQHVAHLIQVIVAMNVERRDIMPMIVKDIADAEGAGQGLGLTQDLGEEDIPVHVAEAVEEGLGLLLLAVQDLHHHADPGMPPHVVLGLALLKDPGLYPGLAQDPDRCHVQEADQSPDLHPQKEVAHHPEVREEA